ncbi:MmpS family transport accessory protein [Herbiconiux sp. P18]|uniref:MmpS family transport accessory protein n=1 Tax=Herbiconiux liangxiaofengii TaxID=3342795 RepID=UPI0035B9AA68
MTNSQQPPYYPPQAPYQPAPPAASRTNGVGIASLIVGGLALLGAFVPFLNYGTGFLAFIGIVLGVIGLVLKGKAKGIAIAGLIVSVVAAILSIILAIVYTAGFAGAVSDGIKDVQASNSAAAAAPVDVTYEVTSTLPTVDVTYSTYTSGNSGTESSTAVAAPFVKDFTVETGGTFDFNTFFLSGNSGSESATITCTITVDGEVVSTQTATGEFAFVTCSASDFDDIEG